MTVAGKTICATIGLLIALASRGVSMAQSEPASPSQETPAQTPTVQTKDTGPDKPAADSSAPTPIRATPEPAQTHIGAHPPRSQPGHSAQPRAQPVTANSFQAATIQMLQNLDAATAIARKAGIAAPSDWGSANQSGDGYSQKSGALKAQLDAAKDDQAVTTAALQVEASLKEVLAAIAANPRPASEGSSADSPERKITRTNPAGVAVTVSLCMAGLALLVSLLTLWRGWFLARRQVDKALIDAGLL
jgi:hypothetical protein